MTTTEQTIVPAAVVPEMKPVQSSNIAAIGHDGASLFVKFNNGAVWKYRGVAVEHHDALHAAESVGRHFNQHIKGKFAGEKIQ